MLTQSCLHFGYATKLWSENLPVPQPCLHAIVYSSIDSHRKIAAGDVTRASGAEQDKRIECHKGVRI